jgi:transcriptional regulator
LYVPDHFAEADALATLMRSHGFAALVTVTNDAPVVSHLPLLFDDARGARGTLVGHMARANPQWRGFDGSAQALAIFNGPHAYISPNWYASAPSVPTWNYAVVHVYGAPRVIDHRDGAKAVLERLVATHEEGKPDPWSLDRLDGKYLDAQLRGIVAFEMPVTHIEGKFKLNQNKSAEDRRGAIAGLRACADAGSGALADLMTRREGG